MKRQVHFTFEVLKPTVASFDGKASPGRRGKLTSPLFVTPDGIIEEFPTKDEQFFTARPLTPILPSDHPKIPVGSGYVTVMRSNLERSARYLRWLNGKREDSRLTLDESYKVFLAEGRAGLKRLFSKSHVFYLLREFKKNGWPVTFEQSENE